MIELLDYLTQLVIKIGISILQIFPSKSIKWLIYQILVFSKYRKQVINKNFNATNLSQDTDTSNSIFYSKNINHLSRIITESTRRLNKKSIAKVKFFNVQKLQNECLKTNGLILLASHYGNWELGCTLLPLHVDVPVYGVYKTVKNKAVDKILLTKRSKYGLHLVPMNKIARVILQNQKNNKSAIYILIADQNPNSKNSIIWTDFLNIRTAYFNGALKLFQKYKFNVAYMKMKVGPTLWAYDVSFDSIIDTSDNGAYLTQSYSDILESQIKEHPEYWLWSHKRWKRSF